MLTKEQTDDIIQALDGLPSEKMPEVKDFILFLKLRYGQPLEGYRDDWDDDDIQDLQRASMQHGDRAISAVW